MSVLGHVGVLAPAVDRPAPPFTTRFMHIDAARHYVYAPDGGLFVPLAELGDSVAEGQPVAEIHFPDTPLREPVTVRAAGAGEIVCKRVPALTRRGDCLFQLAQEHV